MNMIHNIYHIYSWQYHRIVVRVINRIYLKAIGTIICIYYFLYIDLVTVYECLVLIRLLLLRVKDLYLKLFVYPLGHHTVFFIIVFSQTTNWKVGKIQEKKWIIKNKTLIQEIIIKKYKCHSVIWIW